MKVIDRKPVPIYESVCLECSSTIQYKASEVSWGHFACPVCGKVIWADTSNPVRFEEAESNN